MNWERLKRTMWWVLIVALLANVPAIAAMQGESEQQQMGQPAKEPTPEMRTTERGREAVPLHNANEMLGVQIKDTAGQDAGMIENLMIDLQKGRVAAVILSVKDKLYPVPRYAFIEKPDGTCILNMTKDEFTNAPNYEGITDENLNNPDWRQHINDYYSSRISKESVTKSAPGEAGWHHGEMEHPAQAEGMAAPAAQPGRFVMLTDIIGLNVRGADKKDLGQLENVLADARNGYLVYGLISYGGMLGMGEKTAAVPWRALRIQPDLEYVTLNADMAQLEKATVTDADIKKLGQPAYAQRFYEEFNEEPYYWEVFGFVPGMEAKSMRAWMPGSTYNMKFNPAKTETIQGKIKNVGTFRPEKGATSGLRLRVETTDGKMVTVYAGPKEYAAMQDVKFKAGNEVSVTGSPVTIDKKSVIMASEITSAGKTLKLRDEQGKPLWNVESLQEKMQHYKSAPEKGAESKTTY